MRFTEGGRRQLSPRHWIKSTLNSQPSFQRVVCADLRNRYLLLRHGHSEANGQSLIASSPERAIPHFGLTKTGQDQITRMVEQHGSQLACVRQIFTSDFRRTRETANIVAGLLNAPIKEAVSLRERNFGRWDGQSDTNYETVWAADAEDPGHVRWGVESVSSVAERMSRFVKEVDQLGVGQTYLLVSHGDPLQILITASQGQDLGSHRNLDPLATAELRSLC